ncbi:MAG: hemolysin family protein [Geminicoccaceae bacterium]
MRQLAKREQPQPSLLDSLVRRIRDLAGRGGGEPADLREALEELLADADEEGETPIGEEGRELVRNALGFGELRVDDVMVPRADVRGIAVGSSLREVVAGMQDARHSRLLVYRDNLDDVLGVIHLKDLLAYWGDGAEFSLEQAMRQVLVVPPSMRVLDLLLEMRRSNNRIAVVVDEFGGTDGLVTIEDMVEELVGELADEQDRSGPPQLVENPDGTIDADGRVWLEELEEKLGQPLLEGEDRDEADTLGGLIFTLLDRVPTRGELVSHPSGYEFEVLDADPRRIKRVRIHRRAAAD